MFSVIEKIFAPCRHFLLPRMPRHIFAHGREVSAHAIKAVIFASELALRLFGKGSCSCPFFGDCALVQAEHGSLQVSLDSTVGQSG